MLNEDDMSRIKQDFKKTITIYTPTYNRAYTLPNLYNSLTRQTNKDFIWLVIDDGSTDNTLELIEEWKKNSEFTILYFYQENEGKMEKLNFAHKIIETELCTCVDSDDYLVDNAVELILNSWALTKHKKHIGGMIGLDVYEDGSLVGTGFPDSISEIRFCDFNINGIKGDKKFVYKTSVLKEYPPYPSINNEKFPAPGYLYRLIDQKYSLFIIDEPLCVVEYLEDGLSKNKYKQFFDAPNSFAFYRLERIRLARSFNEKFINAMHYISSCLFAKKPVFNGDYNRLLFLAYVPGVILNFYIRMNKNKGAL